MRPLHIETPIVQSQLLKNQLNQSIYFKLESLQPCGSFKMRGIGRLCQQKIAEGAKALVASSGGNAGAAVAYASMVLQKPTTVFIPSSSHPLFIKTIEGFGATVIIAGDTAGDAQTAATAFAKEHHAAYIHPFDDPIIWAGHSTIIDEAVQQMPKPDAVIVAVGGGGLACGLLEGMHRHHWSDVPLIAVETIGADVFAQSVQAKHPVTLTKITSRATSLGSTYVAPKLLAWTKAHCIKNVVVNDTQAELGSRLFAQDQRLLVELASGAALSLVYENHPAIQDFKTILVIACGGLNISHFRDTVDNYVNL